MRNVLLIAAAVALVGSVPLAAQRPRERAPAPAPKAPPRRRRPDAKPEIEHGRNGRPNETPHVRANHWYGHASPNDRRFQLERPYEHGRFSGVGRAHRYAVTRIDRDRHRIWFGGGVAFEIAAWDWPLVADWCWDCGDDFVVYDDPDHVGWYLLYDLRTGVYVHVVYDGP